jgi:hypothetical protein
VFSVVQELSAATREKLARLQSWLTPTNALTLVTSRIGYDVTGFPLDGPVPAPPADASSQTFSRVLYETARRENMTLRDLEEAWLQAFPLSRPGSPRTASDLELELVDFGASLPRDPGGHRLR